MRSVRVHTGGLPDTEGQFVFEDGAWQVMEVVPLSLYPSLQEKVNTDKWASPALLLRPPLVGAAGVPPHVNAS